MATYDFSSLNDKEFETLVMQLLSAEFQVRIERFKSGKDKGVDGRFFAMATDEVVIQCKHWIRTGVAGMLRAIKGAEAAKVTKIAPSRYVFVTSVPLSRDNKSAIRTLFSPYVLSESDVFGPDDLNDLLAKHPSVEKTNYKLWLASASVLIAILNAPIRGRSDFTLKEIKSKARRYVPTHNHDDGIGKLQSGRVIIVTGEPGIGKTMLAEQLCLESVLDGYELCVLADSIEEAEGIFEEGRKQVFYFDDFLGRNYLEALTRHEDTRVIGFINRIRADVSKRFVLTSRTTVLNQGKRLSDSYDHHHVNAHEYEIHIRSLSELDRARILYNHVWHSDLANDFLEIIFSQKKYRQIIEHKNFNPRLIEFITDNRRTTSTSAAEYWTYITNTLDNPSAVWEHTYDVQLDEFCRVFLLLVIINGRRISEGELTSSYQRCLKEMGVAGTATKANFNVVAKIVVGSVITRTLTSSGMVEYSLFNPSIADFVLSRLNTEVLLLTHVFVSLRTIRSIKTISELRRYEYITRQTSEIVAGHMGDRYLRSGYSQSNSEYQFVLTQIMAEELGNVQATKDYIRSLLESVDKLSEDFVGWEALAITISYALENHLVDEEKVWEIIHESSISLASDYDLEALATLFALLRDPRREEFRVVLRKGFVDYWADNIGEAIADSRALEDFYSEEDLQDAERAVEQFIEGRLAGYNLGFDRNDVLSISKYFNTEQALYDNATSGAEPEMEHPKLRSTPVDDGIDDLFHGGLPPAKQ